MISQITLTGLEVQLQSCDHLFTSFALGSVTSQEIRFIKPTLAEKIRTTLGYLNSQVAIGRSRVPKVSSSIPQGVIVEQIHLKVVSTGEY